MTNLCSIKLLWVLLVLVIPLLIVDKNKFDLTYFYFSKTYSSFYYTDIYTILSTAFYSFAYYIFYYYFLAIETGLIYLSFFFLLLKFNFYDLLDSIDVTYFTIFVGILIDLSSIVLFIITLTFLLFDLFGI